MHTRRDYMTYVCIYSSRFMIYDVCAHLVETYVCASRLDYNDDVYVPVSRLDYNTNHEKLQDFI